MSKSSLPTEHLPWMQRALALAQRGQGYTTPNPCVGAVIVRDGKLLGEGYHQRAGAPHAEVLAVRAAHRAGYRDLGGATLYVTLEPCCTHGRTPPCTDLIQRERLARVVVAATDPNPAHAGRGYRILRRAGIEVVTGVCAAEAEALNRGFNHWMRTRRPWVLAKMALSLDGSTVTAPRDDRWITSPRARRLVHTMRGQSGAILIGGETARCDDPALTVRLPHWGSRQQPWRVVWTRSGKLPASLQLLRDIHRDRTWVARGLSLEQIVDALASRGVQQLMIEGGGRVLGSALEAGLVNEIAFFYAPVLLGTARAAVVAPELPARISLTQVRYESLGNELLCRALVTG